jgi:hypothetical protein
VCRRNSILRTESRPQSKSKSNHDDQVIQLPSPSPSPPPHTPLTVSRLSRLTSDTATFIWSCPDLSTQPFPASQRSNSLNHLFPPPPTPLLPSTSIQHWFAHLFSWRHFLPSSTNVSPRAYARTDLCIRQPGGCDASNLSLNPATFLEAATTTTAATQRDTIMNHPSSFLVSTYINRLRTGGVNRGGGRLGLRAMMQIREHGGRCAAHDESVRVSRLDSRSGDGCFPAVRYPIRRSE